jgi:hypothetical protein
MSIKVKSKSVKPSIKAAAPAVAEPKASVTRNRGKVLLEVTPAKLTELIGADTPIGVSAKALKALLVKKQSSDILASVGL